jgi:hypothetical protein
MSEINLESIVLAVVQQANELRLRHVPEYDAHVSYCAIFCQGDAQFKSINAAASSVGTLANDTSTGPVYVIPAIETAIGPLKILKVRKPDPTRPEKGDADFAITKYPAFKAANIGRPGFKLIEREHFEMIELVDPEFDVRAYFSHPPVEEHPGIKEILIATGK